MENLEEGTILKFECNLSIRMYTRHFKCKQNQCVHVFLYLLPQQLSGIQKQQEVVVNQLFELFSRAKNKVTTKDELIDREERDNKFLAKLLIADIFIVKLFSQSQPGCSAHFWEKKIYILKWENKNKYMLEMSLKSMIIN